MTVNAVTAASAGMFGDPVGAIDSTGSTSTTKPSDKDTFLQLLVAQLRYQDPSNPTDSSQFLSQSAQFTALEKMQSVADQTKALLSASMAFGASGLVGRSVSWTDPTGASATGTVDGVSFQSQGPMLVIGTKTVSMGEVTSINGTTPATPATPTAPATPVA
ncbi:flagellar hook capping FlgD N-terminal domain-containing protein [Dermatophilaceae bacterium Soc4.6]